MLNHDAELGLPLDAHARRHSFRHAQGTVNTLSELRRASGAFSRVRGWRGSLLTYCVLTCFAWNQDVG